jgi:hypothetical protein
MNTGGVHHATPQSVAPSRGQSDLRHPTRESSRPHCRSLIRAQRAVRKASAWLQLARLPHPILVPHGCSRVSRKRKQKSPTRPRFSRSPCVGAPRPHHPPRGSLRSQWSGGDDLLTASGRVGTQGIKPQRSSGYRTFAINRVVWRRLTRDPHRTRLRRRERGVLRS